MHTVREPEREIPVVHHADICVVGGSCTGVFAAVRAARLGFRVAIVEKHNCFGGVATAGNVNTWHSLLDTEGKRQIIAGLTLEVLERLEKRGAVLKSPNPVAAYRFNTEELKIELDELVVEHGIRTFLHTLYVAPVATDNLLQAIIIENKNGRQAIRAEQFVDATGDGDLARHLGLPSFMLENLQPPTTCARIYGLGTLRDFDWHAAICRHGHEFGLKDDWGWGSPVPGMNEVQLRADTHVFNVDTSEAEQLTGAEIEGRRQIRAIMDIIRKYGPCDSAIALDDLAATIGARETRRMAALYRITGEDVLYGRRFDDAVVNGSYCVDMHHTDGAGITFRYLDGTQLTIPRRGAEPVSGRWRDSLPEDPTFYQVPFRCLVQDKIQNLSYCGRMIDADKLAFSALRVMVNTNQTGEAVGVACGLALQEGCAPSKVNPQKLRRTLAKGGSIVI